MPTETRTFVGQTGGPIFDGWAGFRVGQVYQLEVTHQDGEVHVTIPHGSPQGPLVLRAAEWTTWFQPVA